MALAAEELGVKGELADNDQLVAAAARPDQPLTAKHLSTLDATYHRLRYTDHSKGIDDAPLPATGASRKKRPRGNNHVEQELTPTGIAATLGAECAHPLEDKLQDVARFSAAGLYVSQVLKDQPKCAALYTEDIQKTD